MSDLRELLQRHRAIVLTVASGLCLIAATMIVWRVAGSFSPPTSPPRIAQDYFYDLNTDTLFLAPAESEVPLKIDTGDYQGRAAGVRAVVFSCGSCGDPKQRFVGWLEMPDPNFDEASLESEGSSAEEPSGMLIRSPKGTQWHSLDSREAESITQEAQSRCGEGETIRPCTPPSAVAK